MKRNLALTGILLTVCALAGAQENTGNRVVVPARSGSRPRVVEANVIHGSITVKTGSGGEVIAEVPGMKPRNDSRVPPGMHRIDMPWRGGLNVEESGDVVRITLGPGGENNDLQLTVPTNTSVRAHTTHGDVTVTGAHGEIDAGSVHGDITLTNVSGTVLANTVHGTIKVSMDQVDQSKPLSFSTLSGGIDVTFPADTKMNVSMKANRGDIWTDFDMKLNGGSGFGMARNLNGTINGGGVDVKFYTLNGRITIHKK